MRPESVEIKITLAGTEIGGTQIDDAVDRF